MFLTQPAISKRIAALEQELGTRLFDRISRRIHLTETGRALLMRARSIINELDDAKRGIANLTGAIGDDLALATSHHIGLHRLPPALKRFHQSYPHVQLDLRFMDSEAACEAVLQGNLELAIVTLPPKSITHLEMVPVWDDPLEIVVSRSHPLAKTSNLDIKTLLTLPAILPGSSTYTRAIILKALGSMRSQIRIGMSTNYLEVLKMLASIGLGWSALPRTMIDAELKVVQIKNMNIRRRLGIVTHAKRTLSNAARAMIETVQQTA